MVMLCDKWLQIDWDTDEIEAAVLCLGEFVLVEADQGLDRSGRFAMEGEWREGGECRGKKSD